jgi:autotransporter-associated beta strand protein
LTVNGAGDITFNGVVQNSEAGSTGSLTKTGAGTLILSNANTYNGSTSVTGGTLLVTNTTGSGTGTSSVVITNAGTILTGGTTTGAGGISGPVGINPSATLSPGTSGTGAGTTAILNTGALTLVSASNFNVDLNSLTAGTGYDQLDVTGTVNVSGCNLGVTVGGAFALGDKFFITLNDGTDLVTGTFAQVGTVTANNGYTFLINYIDNGDGGLVGNDISLTLTAIPEPSTWIGAMLALGVLGFVSRSGLRKAA